MPAKKIKKKVYDRSKWRDFNKFKVTFIFKQFALNMSQLKHKISWLGPNPDESKFSPLTKWFLLLPRTQGRAQQIVKLAFIYHYKYTQGKGTQIASFKDKANPFFNAYLDMENHPDIGIDKINDARQKHRQVLRHTTQKVMRDYIAKTNQRKPGKRARMTKKHIEKEEQQDFFKELQKFFNQLVKEPTKAEIAQQYSDPEEFDDEKEYNSDNEIPRERHYDSEDESEQLNPEVNQGTVVQRPVVEQNIVHPNTQNDNDEEIYCAPSLLQSKKSFNFSQFDSSQSIQSDSEKVDLEIPRNLKKTSSDDSDKFSFKKTPSIDLNQTDQEFERNQLIIAAKQRERDLNGWIDF